MAKNIHPKYYDKAKISCACGASFEIGATKPEINVEICSKCHPFYTGKEKVIDIAGRVERFKKRKTKSQTTPKTNKKEKRATRTTKTKKNTKK